jgi:hypothetical protein
LPRLREKAIEDLQIAVGKCKNRATVRDKPADHLESSGPGIGQTSRKHFFVAIRQQESWAPGVLAFDGQPPLNGESDLGPFAKQNSTDLQSTSAETPEILECSRRDRRRDLSRADHIVGAVAASPGYLGFFELQYISPKRTSAGRRLGFNPAQFLISIVQNRDPGS